jgi:hypothetical protein
MVDVDFEEYPFWALGRIRARRRTGSKPVLLDY